MIKLKNYQKKAVKNLKEKVEHCFKSSENEICIFQSPTGSGKTVMVSRLLKKLARDIEYNNKLSFVWLSVRKLHEQSKKKLEKYYEDDRLIECSYFEDLIDKKIGENEILFLNWSSINKKDINIYVKDNEKGNNLNNIIQNTKDHGRKIILIIDESHHTAHTDKSRELIETISPKVTIEFSATPKLTSGADEIEKVHLSEVKEEEMIKSEILVNPEFSDLKIGSRSSDELVVEQALKKREELSKMYNREGSAINPLVLIQLPDEKKSDLINKKRKVLKILRDKFDITEQNGKLAIWLSGDKNKINLENIEKQSDKAEVLVFKEAPNIGWDCPRASILVIFRESKSFIFTIQTIGRIMRMPELKYYLKEPELNKGFVFTNLSNIEIAEDYAEDYISIYESKRDNERYEKLSLPSIYLKRQRERTRLSGKFVDIFIEVAEEFNLKDKITKEPSKLVFTTISDGIFTNIDEIGEIDYDETIKFKLDEKEIQNKFDEFITQNCSPYAPVDSSDRLKTALYQFLNKSYKIKKYSSKAQKIVLGEENVQDFVNAINLAKEKYKKEVVEKVSEVREKIEIPEWEVPLIISYNDKAKKQNHPKSIMQPFYILNPSDPEEEFMDFLDESDKVKWWFKNRESEIKYFAVLRKDGLPFYPDFIVKFKDDTIGIFDTKKGRTASTEEAGPRAEGLQKYIKEQNKKGQNLWGGIVIFINGSWRYNNKDKYDYDSNDLTDWEILEI